VYAAHEQIEKLRECLVQARVGLAVLFGSQATGKARPGSDFDVGILPLDEMSLGDELALASALSEATGTEVDLVRLDQDNPLLAREIAEQGTCLYEREKGLFSAYRARAMSTWIDFEETIAVHRMHRLKRLAGQV
jgi:uncharacterized protein